jgi:hypothetical protein
MSSQQVVIVKAATFENKIKDKGLSLVQCRNLERPIITT